MTASQQTESLPQFGGGFYCHFKNLTDDPTTCGPVGSTWGIHRTEGRPLSLLSREEKVCLCGRTKPSLQDATSHLPCPTTACQLSVHAESGVPLPRWSVSARSNPTWQGPQRAFLIDRWVPGPSLLQQRAAEASACTTSAPLPGCRLETGRNFGFRQG